MRSNDRVERGAAVAVDRRPRVLQTLGWSHRDAVGFIVALIACVMILVNMLFLQSGSHPAPMVKSGVVASVPGPMLAGTTSTILPRPRPAEIPQPKVELAKASPASPAPAPPAPTTATRVNAAVVGDIQRELSRRGFYDGMVDGKYGPRTDASIRDFEQAAALRPSVEPNEALLRAIKGSPVRSRPANAANAAKSPAPPARPDPIGEMLAPSKQVIAVQRALSEFGYGQIKPSGLVDRETQSAIEKFERERKLLVTGQLSNRVVRELAVITGRPLE